MFVYYSFGTQIICSSVSAFHHVYLCAGLGFDFRECTWEFVQRKSVAETGSLCAMQEMGVADEHSSAILGAVEATRDAVLGKVSDEQKS